MELRIATSRETEILAALAIEFRDHLQRTTPTDAQFRISIRRLLASPDAEFYLATGERGPIGYVLQRFRFSMWASGLEATIEDLFVAPSQRQKGAGQQLIQFAVARAQAKGCASICLDTNENNLASTKIYTELGFNAVSKRWNGRQVFYRLNLTRPNPAPAAPAEVEEPA